MDVALVNSLAEREAALVRETQPEQLAALDEDALVELHTRVRRARDRQVKVYRRQAAALVPEVGGRGKGHSRDSRNRAKAEVLEDALARVSQQLAAAARKSAAALRLAGRTPATPGLGHGQIQRPRGRRRGPPDSTA
jgi:hypothetical protein